MAPPQSFPNSAEFFAEIGDFSDNLHGIGDFVQEIIPPREQPGTFGKRLRRCSFSERDQQPR